MIAGAFIVAASLYLMLRAQRLTGLVERVYGSHWVYLAALLRLLLGAGLIASAPGVAWPRVIEGLGWLFVLGALALVILPPRVLRRWSRGLVEALSPWQSRAFLGLALVLGAGLIWAALA